MTSIHRRSPLCLAPLSLTCALAGVAARSSPAMAQEDLDDVTPAPLSQPGQTQPGPSDATDATDATAAGADAAPPADSDTRAAGKKSGKGDKGTRGSDADKDSPDEALQLGGRVFVRASAFDTDAADWTGQLELASVRLGASYRWKDRLRVKGVLEAAGKVSVRDAYLEVPLAHHVELRAGRFKGPVSAIEQASAWDLPSIDRGAVADILQDGLGLTGRRDGLELAWSPRKGGPKVSLVLSQSMATTGDEPARPLADGAGVTAALRAELAPTPTVRLGAVVSNREVNYVKDVGRFWAGGVDAEVDLHDAGLGLRLWADALVGQSHLAADSADQPTTFLAGQVIAGWRLGGAKKGKRYLEPYVLAAYLNPDLGHKLDHVADTAVGLAGGRWKRWRAQVQASRLGTWSRRPPALGGFDVDVDDRISVSAQLGAAF